MRTSRSPEPDVLNKLKKLAAVTLLAFLGGCYEPNTKRTMNPEIPIHPGIGVGAVTYGIQIEDLISKLGVPDSRSFEQSEDDNRYSYEEVWYDKQKLCFWFDTDDDFRLGTILIKSAGYNLFGKDLFDLSRNELVEFISSISKEKMTYDESLSESDGFGYNLDHDGLGLVFWFKSNRVSAIQCSYLYESEDGTVAWPNLNEQTENKAVETMRDSAPSPHFSVRRIHK